MVVADGGSNKRVALLTPDFRRLMLAQSAFSFAWSLFFLVPKFLTVELHASASEIGMVSAIPPAMGALMVPVLGSALDRLGRRPVVIVGMASVLAYSLGFQLVDRVGPLLFGLQLLQGVAFTLTFNGNATVAADLAPPERLSQAMGIFGSANVVMNAVAPSVAELLEARYSWSAAFYASSVAAALGLALSFWTPEGSPDGDPPRTRPPIPQLPLKALLYDMAIMVGAGGAFSTVFTFYQPYAVQLGMQDLRDFFIGFTLAVLLMRLGFGGAFDRMGRQRVAIGSAALYVVTVLAMTQLTPTTLMLLGGFMGLAHGIFYPTMNALAIEGAGRQERGRVTVFFNGGFQIGHAACVVLLGPLADSHGYPALFVVGAALAAAALVLVTAREGFRHRLQHPPHAER